jgi:hypothetical protein
MTNMTSKIGMSVAAAALVSTSAAVAQAQTAAIQAEPAIPVVTDLKWYLNESVDIHTFKGSGSTLFALNSTIGVDLTKDISLNLNIPVYSQDDNTTVSNISLGGSWDFIGGNNDVINKWDLALGGGVYLPVGSEYFRNANVNPYLNAAFDCKMWLFDFEQTAEYRFNGGESYITWLGAKTDSDVVTLVSDLSYKWNSFDFGAQFDQVYYVNSGENQLFLGPVAKWHVASNIDLNAGVLIPVSQNVATPEANAIVTAGIAIKF